MPQRIPGDAATRCDRALDAVVALLAAWTLAYHLCLLARWGTTVALVITAVLLAVFVLVERSTRNGEAGPAADSLARPSPPRGQVSDRVARGVLPVAALLAAVATAVDAPWVLVWVPWLLAAVAGTWWALRHVGEPVVGPADPGARADRLTVVTVATWTVVVAALAACLRRSNPDDLYYLNLSQWVAGHGSFPLRDTLYADLVYPMSNWPPTASYDALVGTAARLVGTHAATLAYVVVPPVASALAVLALWRLLRAWRVEWVAYALSVALVFLLFNQSLGYGNPGGLFLSRIWQGKVVLLCVVVPLVLARLAGFAEQPSRRGAAGLALTGIAAVALSTTALFLVPVLAVAGAAPLVRRAPRQAALGFLATSAYALAGVVVTLVVGGRSADDFGARRLYRFDAAWIGHQVFLTGPLTVGTVTAVLLAVVLVRHPAARATSAVLVLVLGVVLVPGAVRLAYQLTGLGPTLWRLSWGCTIAALVGAGAVRLTRWAHDRLPGRWPTVAAVLVPVLLIGFGQPVWAVGSTAWSSPTDWKRWPATLDAAREVLDRSDPGDIVLAPDSLAVTIAVTTTEVKTVSPRAYYMYYLRHDPTFHYPARLRLERYVNGGTWHAAAVAQSLDVLGVRTVCLGSARVRRGSVLERSGYTPLTASATYRCWQRR